MLLVVTSQHGDLLAVVWSLTDLQKTEEGVASVVRSPPPVVLISLNDNYCLNAHTDPNSVKEPNVGFVSNQDIVVSVQNVNFFSNNQRSPQNKGVSPSVNLTNVSIKDVNFVHSLSYSVSVPSAPVRSSSTKVVPKLSQTRFKSI